jgi:hypothetical protein
MGSIVAEIADKIASAGGGERSELEVRGGVGADGGGILTLSTSELTVVDGDKLGRIDFQAPLETGTDAILVSASIWAEADDTFAADNNSTELVFAVGASEAAAEKMRLTHDGELGIGVATPASLLHVAGTVQVGVDDTGHDVIFYGDAAGALAMWDTSENALFVRGASADAVGSSGRIVLQTNQPAVADGDIIGRIDWSAPAEHATDGNEVAASIWAEADDTFAADNNSAELVFATGASEIAVERMRIDHDGKVGIGTSDPLTVAHIKGTSVTNGDARYQLTIEDTTANTQGVGGGLVFRGKGSNGNSYEFGAIWTEYDSATYHASLHFSGRDSGQNFSSDMVLNENGNVGIGTTAPDTPLTIKQTALGAGVKVIGHDNTYAGYFGIGTSGYLTLDALGDRGIILDADSVIIFKTDDNERMRINATGNVGIGTTTPNATADTTLHIKGASSASLDIEDDEKRWNFYVNGYMNIRENTTSRIFIAENTGKVGIGTTSPATLLEVHGGAETLIRTDRTNSGQHINFSSNGSDKGNISESGGTVSYNAFTGSHYGWAEDNTDAGKCLIMTGTNKYAYSDSSEEIIYGLVECSDENDSRFLGAYLALIESDLDKTVGVSKVEGVEASEGVEEVIAVEGVKPNPDLIMSVGNGDMWVVNEGENITQGDCLITSTSKGHARVDPETATYSFIIARAGEPVDWSTVTELFGGKKHKKINVLFDSCKVKN